MAFGILTALIGIVVLILGVLALAALVTGIVLLVRARGRGGSPTAGIVLIVVGALGVLVVGAALVFVLWRMLGIG